jgi:hypothetical protein
VLPELAPFQAKDRNAGQLRANLRLAIAIRTWMVAEVSQGRSLHLSG